AFLDFVFSWLGLVWLMNVYNFIDGIDAMAATAAIFVSAAAALVLFVEGTQKVMPADVGVMLVFGLVAVCSFGFLIFNWPPASMFMGDSGSLFLGFVFGAMIAKTVLDDQMSMWTWVIIFGYLAGDTTTTTILRIFVTSKWYGEHRSHAYQNLALIWGSLLTDDKESSAREDIERFGSVRFPIRAADARDLAEHDVLVIDARAWLTHSLLTSLIDRARHGTEGLLLGDSRTDRAAQTAMALA